MNDWALKILCCPSCGRGTVFASVRRQNLFAVIAVKDILLQMAFLVLLKIRLIVAGSAGNGIVLIGLKLMLTVEQLNLKIDSIVKLAG